MNKKGETSITLLVLMTVLLVGATLFLFVVDSANIKEEISDGRFLDEIYVKEEKLDFYVNEIMESSIEKSKNSLNFKEDFVGNFSYELEKCKKSEELDDEFLQILNALNDLEIANEKVILRVNFPIKYETDSFKAVHQYTKTFEKEVK